MRRPHSEPSALIWWSDRIALLGLILAGAVWPFPQGLMNVALGIAIVAWLVNKWVSHTALPRTTANAPLGFRLVAGMLSMANSISMRASLRGLTKLAKVTAIFFVTADVVRTKRRVSALLTAVMIGAAVVSLDGLLQVWWGVDPLYHNPAGSAMGGLRRLTATFHHGNDFGVYGVAILPVCLAVALGTTRRGTRWWSWGVAALLSLALALSLSRPAALGVAVSLTVFLAIRRAWRTLAALGCATVVGLVHLPAPIREWMASQDSWLDILSQPDRPQIWQAALNMFRAHPISGVGINTFVLNYARYKLPSDPIPSAYAHNHYLHLSAEVGVVGLAVFGWLLVCACQMWRRLLQDPDPWVRVVSTGLGCGVIGFLTAGLLESALQSSHTNLSFWMWCGMLAGMALQQRASRSSRQTRDRTS